MSVGESMNSRSFEVRCPRCEVTFPVETKRCVHCGGAMRKGRIISFNRKSSTSAPTDYSAGYSTDGEAIESAYGLGDGLGDEEFVFRDEGGAASSTSDAGDRMSRDAGEKSSPIKSLIRSMGGVIWILLLVGFSLVRSCGGE